MRKNKNPRIRRLAALKLGKIRPVIKEGVRTLIEAATDANEKPYVRRQAAMALGEIGPQAAEATGVLTDIAVNKGLHEMIREPCLSALQEIGALAEPALPKLKACLSTEDDLSLLIKYTITKIEKEASLEKDKNKPQPQGKNLQGAGTAAIMYMSCV